MSLAEVRRHLARPVACLAALSALLASGAARAEEPAPAPRAAPVGALLHDDRAVASWVRQRQPQLLAAEARVAQARADVGAAGVLAPNPEVDVTIGGIQVGKPNPLNPAPAGGYSFSSTANVGVGVTQTIELGKRGPRVAAAELRAEGAGKGYLDALGDRIADARASLARVAWLRAKMALLEDNLAGARRAAELQKARLDRGAVSGNDYDRLLLDNISLEADVARARADLDGALSTCAALMAAPCDAGSAGIADIDAAAPLPAAINADLERRPDVQAARLEGAASEKDAVLAERRAIPDPSVRVGFVHDMYLIGGSQPNTLAVTLTVPIPLFDHGQHDAARARARAVEQRHLAGALLSGARSDLSGLLSRKAFLESALKTLDTVAVPKSTGILDATLRAFDQGQVSMTDLLLARRTHLSLVLSQMDLHFEHFSVRSDLRHTLGLDAAGQPAAGAAVGSASQPPRPRVGSR